MLYSRVNDLLNGKDRHCLKRSKLQVWLESRQDGAIAAKLVDTDIVTWYPDGRIVLDSGGWQTTTTKARMNDYLPKPWGIYQEKGLWYLWRYDDRNADPITFADGITIYDDGTITGEGTDPAGLRKLQRAVNTYAKDFARSLWNGNVPAPSGADCWYCALRTQDGIPLGEGANSDHIRSHIEERYYVPSLLVRASEIYPLSPLVRSMIADLWYGDGITTGSGSSWQDVFERQVSSTLKRYCRKGLGLPS